MPTVAVPRPPHPPPRQRPDRRDPRPRPVDPRRHHGPAQGDRRRSSARTPSLFEPGRPGTRWLRVQRGGYGRGDLFFKGENPPDGALLHYFLKAEPATPATLEISDPTGDRQDDLHPRRRPGRHQPRSPGTSASTRRPRPRRPWPPTSRSRSTRPSCGPTSRTNRRPRSRRP
ncbi:MAG: hypothetical protein M0C28_41905 [Candidatus Moduliflexus flocculans]|nr:hypothetical protein [Candidatus Moduliflexus flocculans]